jgi:hypothetical protein
MHNRWTQPPPPLLLHYPCRRFLHLAVAIESLSRRPEDRSRLDLLNGSLLRWDEWRLR